MWRNMVVNYVGYNIWMILKLSCVRYMWMIRQSDNFSQTNPTMLRNFGQTRPTMCWMFSSKFNQALVRNLLQDITYNIVTSWSEFKTSNLVVKFIKCVLCSRCCCSSLCVVACRWLLVRKRAFAMLQLVCERICCQGCVVGSASGPKPFLATRFTTQSTSLASKIVESSWLGITRKLMIAMIRCWSRRWYSSDQHIGLGVESDWQILVICDFGVVVT